MIETVTDLKENFDWYWISKYQDLSEEFIEEHSNKVHWNRISIFQKLSEEFIEKYSDKVHWNWISEYQDLSEEFIEEHSNKVHWVSISKYQSSSDKVLAATHYCGINNRPIVIYKDNPEVIHIGCFKGNKEDALEAVGEKYGEDSEYYQKVIDTFEEAKNERRKSDGSSG